MSLTGVSGVGTPADSPHLLSVAGEEEKECLCGHLLVKIPDSEIEKLL